MAALQDGKAEAVQLEKLRADVASAARFEVSCDRSLYDLGITTEPCDLTE